MKGGLRRAIQCAAQALAGLKFGPAAKRRGGSVGEVLEQLNLDLVDTSRNHPCVAITESLDAIQENEHTPHR